MVLGLMVLSLFLDETWMLMLSPCVLMAYLVMHSRLYKYEEYDY
jgi:hypothetical protein